jgi:hypothetical protein
MQNNLVEIKKDENNEMVANIEDESTSHTPKFDIINNPLTHKLEFQVLKTHIPVKATSQKNILNVKTIGVSETSSKLCSLVEEDPTFSIALDE